MSYHANTSSPISVERDPDASFNTPRDQFIYPSMSFNTGYGNMTLTRAAGSESTPLLKITTPQSASPSDFLEPQGVLSSSPIDAGRRMQLPWLSYIRDGSQNASPSSGSSDDCPPSLSPSGAGTTPLDSSPPLSFHSDFGSPADPPAVDCFEPIPSSGSAVHGHTTPPPQHILDAVPLSEIPPDVPSIDMPFRGLQPCIPSAGANDDYAMYQGGFRGSSHLQDSSALRPIFQGLLTTTPPPPGALGAGPVPFSFHSPTPPSLVPGLRTVLPLHAMFGKQAPDIVIRANPVVSPAAEALGAGPAAPSSLAPALTAPASQISCPGCHKVDLWAREADFQRHVKTHDGRYICCGVKLSTSQAAHLTNRSELRYFDGIPFLGGCGRTFSRKDAFQRHLDRAKKQCAQDDAVCVLKKPDGTFIVELKSAVTEDKAGKGEIGNKRKVAKSGTASHARRSGTLSRASPYKA